mmetsp:Transcript_51299/g.135108  ORF Transcript_51299/g.135108 Transcript_51299/m.135108 type:complete len:251 (+) Transcript_51299:780-1532(+)
MQITAVRVELPPGSKMLGEPRADGSVIHIQRLAEPPGHNHHVILTPSHALQVPELLRERRLRRRHVVLELVRQRGHHGLLLALRQVADDGVAVVAVQVRVRRGEGRHARAGNWVRGALGAADVGIAAVAGAGGGVRGQGPAALAGGASRMQCASLRVQGFIVQGIGTRRTAVVGILCFLRALLITMVFIALLLPRAQPGALRVLVMQVAYWHNPDFRPAQSTTHRLPREGLDEDEKPRKLHQVLATLTLQ